MQCSREGERGCTRGVQQGACDVPAPEQRCQLPCRSCQALCRGARCHEKVPGSMQRCQVPCRCASCCTEAPTAVQICQMSCRGASHCANVPDVMQGCQPLCRCAGCRAGCQLLCKCARYYADVPAAVQMCKTSCRVPAFHPPSPGFDGKWPLSAVMGMACGDVGCSKKNVHFPSLAPWVPGASSCTSLTWPCVAAFLLRFC